MKSKKQAIELCEAFDKYGKSWKNGKSFLDDNKFDKFKEETCYINTREFCSRKSLINTNYIIYEFEQINLCEYEIDLNKFFSSNTQYLAINVRNEQEDELLRKAFCVYGKKWSSGESYLDNTGYYFSDKTCYNNQGYAGEYNDLLKKGYHIYMFD